MTNLNEADLKLVLKVWVINETVGGVRGGTSINDAVARCGPAARLE